MPASAANPLPKHYPAMAHKPVRPAAARLIDSKQQAPVPGRRQRLVARQTVWPQHNRTWALPLAVAGIVRRHSPAFPNSAMRCATGGRRAGGKSL